MVEPSDTIRRKRLMSEILPKVETQFRRFRDFIDQYPIYFDQAKLAEVDRLFDEYKKAVERITTGEGPPKNFLQEFNAAQFALLNDGLVLCCAPIKEMPHDMMQQHDDLRHAAKSKISAIAQYALMIDKSVNPSPSLR